MTAIVLSANQEIKTVFENNSILGGPQFIIYHPVSTVLISSYLLKCSNNIWIKYDWSYKLIRPNHKMVQA